MKQVFNTVRIKDFEQYIMGMLQRLMNGDASSKMAAISLFPTVYPQFGLSSQQEIMQMYTNSSTDEVP